LILILIVQKLPQRLFAAQPRGWLVDLLILSPELPHREYARSRAFARALPVTAVCLLNSSQTTCFLLEIVMLNLTGY
ncbi:MAG: hypothetical protein WCK89_21130, partial [bacterium]